MTLINSINQDIKKAKLIGICLVVAGILCLLAPFAVGLSITWIVGIFLLVGGIAQLIAVFLARSFRDNLMPSILGAIAFIVGCYLTFSPASSLGVLTLILAGYFLVTGAMEAIWAFSARPATGWGWLFFSGVITFILGLMIWMQFPLSGVWAVGTLVGVHLILSGWIFFAIAGSVQQA
ncbi:HdeD family acid-resistance protein [Marinobacter sp. F4206]|uniref:HdeD family acid-resistance protein n=1 Tax=Marinobacter sp. F4206 TaxID=2861777 RepID=UPI001C5CF84F|nr:HdeD family acid-resistance protein [Marinobacter sp. F4206]MBW4936017.1 HdeD family acid-resistance protein [Marinobacter sp. F4206]